MAVKRIWAAADMQMHRPHPYHQPPSHPSPGHDDTPSETQASPNPKPKPRPRIDSHDTAWIPSVRPPLSLEWTASDSDEAECAFEFNGCADRDMWTKLGVSAYLDSRTTPSSSSSLIIFSVKTLSGLGLHNDEWSVDPGRYVRLNLGDFSVRATVPFTGGNGGSVRVTAMISGLSRKVRYALQLCLDPTLTSALQTVHKSYFKLPSSHRQSHHSIEGGVAFHWSLRQPLVRASSPSSSEPGSESGAGLGYLCFAAKRELTLPPRMPQIVHWASQVRVRHSEEHGQTEAASVSSSPSLSSSSLSAPLLLPSIPGTALRTAALPLPSPSPLPPTLTSPVSGSSAAVSDSGSAVAPAPTEISLFFDSPGPVSAGSRPSTPSPAKTKTRTEDTRTGTGTGTEETGRWDLTWAPMAAKVNRTDLGCPLSCRVKLAWQPSEDDLPQHTFYELQRRTVVRAVDLTQAQSLVCKGQWDSIVKAERFNPNLQRSETYFDDLIVFASAQGRVG